MNWIIDVMLAVVLLVSAIVGAARGLTVSAFAIAGVYFGLKWAADNYSIVGDIFFFIENPTHSKVIGYLVICLGTMMLAAVVAIPFKRLFYNIKLGFLDRAFGLLSGLAVGAIICELLLLWLYYNYSGMQSPIENSKITSFLFERVGDYTPLVTDFVHKVFR